MRRAPFTKPSEALAYAAKCVEYGWTQKRFAADAAGLSIDPRDQRAARFCVVGGICRATPGVDLRRRALDVLHRVVGHNLSDWNDAPKRTQAQVVAALREAARRARAEERRRG